MVFSCFSEATFDVNKVYLATINKFNAMACITNAYAPDGITCLFISNFQVSHANHMKKIV